MLHYGRQSIDERDVQAVTDVLLSNYLTTGPMVGRFESAFAKAVGTQHAIAVSSGTAALHSAVAALGIGAGDEVIVPAITFAASSNTVLYEGGTPVFADVDPETLLLDSEDVVRKITPNTRAIVAVDYAGQPCDYDTLSAIANEYDLKIIADACHSLGGMYNNRPCGSLADISCFSLHPVKAITAGEGGVATTDNSELAWRMSTFRNHGITTDHNQRHEQGKHVYDMKMLGCNYRISDIACALAHSQLQKLGEFTRRRQQIAARYYSLLKNVQIVEPLVTQLDVHHAYHLFVVRCKHNRDQLFDFFRDAYINPGVHYRPVYQHSYYQELFGDKDFGCPNSEQVYKEIISLPIFPEMQDYQIDQVAKVLKSFEAQHLTSAAA